MVSSRTFMSQSRHTRFRVEYQVTDEGVVRFEETALEKRVRGGKRNYVKVPKFMRVDELVMNAFRPNPAPYFYTCVDHINRDLGDDRLCNLRWSNATLRKFNMTELPGVRASRPGSERYMSRVCFRGRDYCLGTFETAEEARRAYKRRRDLLIKEYVVASTGLEPHASLVPTLTLIAMG
jgi:hypothetical protein